MTTNRGIVRKYFAVALAVGAIALAGFALNGLARKSPPAGPSSAAQTSASALPKDVDPASGFRLPLLKRDDLDEEGKKVYDILAGPTNPAFAGLRGPDGVLLYDPKLALLNRDLNQYLRYQSGLSGKVRELAILVTARQLNSQLEWTTHEAQALKEGLDPKIVDVVKYRKTTAGLPETESAVIQLGRELIGKNHVSSETFARALKLFGPRPLVNLVLLFGNYSQTATLVEAFNIQLAEGRKPLLPMP